MLPTEKTHLVFVPKKITSRSFLRNMIIHHLFTLLYMLLRGKLQQLTSVIVDDLWYEICFDP
jgi:hypothetical protein